MDLLEVRIIEGVTIERNREFNSLGYLSHENENMLVYINHESYFPQLAKNLSVACVIASHKLAHEVPEEFGLAIAVDPKRAFLEFHNYLATGTDFYWSDFENEIAEGAMIDPSAHIAPRNVRIGSGTVVEAGAVIMEHSIIGKECTIRAGVLIGTHGFEFKRLKDGVQRVAHAGGVLLHDRVEIQNNTNVNRAVFGGFTEIGEDSKISSLVHIGHNAKIGKRTFIAANSMIAGCVIGDDVWVGPSVSIISGLIIGDGAFLSIGAVVTKDVPSGKQVTGNFAIEHHKFIEFIRSIR